MCSKMGAENLSETQIYDNDGSEYIETIEDGQNEFEEIEQEEHEAEDKDRYVIEPIILDPAQVDNFRNILSAGEEEEEMEKEEEEDHLELTEIQQEQIKQLPIDDHEILIKMVKSRNTLRKSIVLEPILTKEILEKGLKTEGRHY